MGEFVNEVPAPTDQPRRPSGVMYPVIVRLVLSDGSEQWRPGKTVRWTQRAVYVSWETIRVLPTDQALAAISAFHQGFVQQRLQALAALEALEAIRTEQASEGGATADDIMTITQLAGALGVRPSTLRFWGHEGLIAPERVTIRSVSARRYPPAAIREARITAALRAAGYRIPDVRHTITTIRDLHDTQQPVETLQARPHHIAD